MVEQVLASQLQQNPQLTPYREVMQRFLNKYMNWESLQGMARRVESRNGETHTKLQGPTGSQIGHSSPSAGKPRTWRRP